MDKNGLLIGEVAKRSGASRKALQIYEAAGILPAARRTASGYRVYDGDTLRLLAFIRQAQGLGVALEEVKEIVSIKRAGTLREVVGWVISVTDEDDRPQDRGGVPTIRHRERGRSSRGRGEARRGCASAYGHNS
jgi:MerR family transcriptional regulator, copper efflux regulator